MSFFGEIISLAVAVSWTVTALSAEVASRRIGTLQLNVFRMVLSLAMLSLTLWVFTGHAYPYGAGGEAWFWLSLSGFVGYVLGDYCLFNSYLWIGARFGQLFMTLAPLAAALAGWFVLGERLSMQALLGMLVTLTGIGISVLNKGGHHKLSLKLPWQGVLFGIGAGIGQGVGLVLSKVGMNYYVLPAGASDTEVMMLPFASTFIRAITGAIGFLLVMAVRRQFHTLPQVAHDRKGMATMLLATLTGPFIGVSLSLMAVQYTEAGIASTLMALTPIFIIAPAYWLFRQPVSLKEVVGAVISVIGVSLFFL